MSGEHSPSAIIGSEATILSQLPSHGYGSVEHWQKVWPEDAEAAAILNWAQKIPTGMSEEAGRIAAVASENHRGLLSTVAGDLEARTQQDKSLVAQPFGLEDESYFEYKGARPPLDLKKLGLPPLENPDGLEPLGVVVHRRAEDDAVIGVELLVMNGQRVEGRLLEDISAVGAKNGTTRRWINPGDSLLSAGNIEPVAELMNPPKSGASVIKVKAKSLYDRPVGRTEIIRSTPTRLEKQAAHPEHTPKTSKYVKVGRTLAAATAALSTALFLSPEAQDPNQNKRITSAHELVLPGGTLKHGGLTQAEAFFREPELSRSRAAFEAYFKGDQEALRAQAQAHGYETGWMQPEAIAAIEKAESYDALVAAFNKAFEGLPITLATYNTEQMPPGLKVAGDTVHKQTTNLNLAKQQAMTIVQLFNGVFDREELKSDMDPFEYHITGSLVKDGDITLGGYHIMTEDENGKPKHVIAISDTTGVGTTAHETIHGLNLNKEAPVGGNLSWKIGAVSHPDHEPATLRTYHQTPTTVDGWNNVARPYGNVDQGEDTATSGEAVLSTTPVLLLQNSPLGEKQMTLIFQMEKESPGFTASLLQHAKTSTIQREDDPMNNFLFEAQKYKVGAGVVLTLSVVALLSGLRRSRLLQPIARRLRRKEAASTR